MMWTPSTILPYSIPNPIQQQEIKVIQEVKMALKLFITIYLSRWSNKILFAQT